MRIGISCLFNRRLALTSTGMAVGLALAASACSSQKKPEDAAEPKRELPPLVAADAPANLVAKMRIKDPAALLSALGKDVGTTMSPVELLNELEEGVGDGLADLIAFDAAFEAAVVLSPEPMQPPYVGFSFGVVGVEEMVAYLKEHEETVIEGADYHFYFPLNDNAECVVGRSFGKSPARVVCSPDDEALKVVMDYQLRGMPAEDLGGAAGYLGIELAPVREAYGQYLPMLRQLAVMGVSRNATGDESVDQPMSEFALALAGEVIDLAQDIDTIEYAVEQNAEGYGLLANVSFAGQSSWVAQLAAELSQVEGKMPPALKNASADNIAAFYSLGLTPERFERPLTLVGNFVGALAQSEGLPKAKAVKLAEAVKQAKFFFDDIYSVTGPLQKLEAKNEQGAAFAPSYQLIVSQAPAEELGKLYEELGALSSDKELIALLDDEDFADTLPKIEKVKKLPAGLKDAQVFRMEYLIADLETEFDAAAFGAGFDPEGNYVGGTISAEEQKRVDAAAEKKKAADRAERLRERYFAILKVESGSQLLVTNTLQELSAAQVAAQKAQENAAGTGAGLHEGPGIFAAGAGSIDGYFASFVDYLPEEIASDWANFAAKLPHQGKSRLSFQFSSQQVEGKLLFGGRIDIPSSFVADASQVVRSVVESKEAETAAEEE